MKILKKSMKETPQTDHPVALCSERSAAEKIERGPYMSKDS